MTRLERLMEAHRDGATIAYKDLLDVLEEQEEMKAKVAELEADNARLWARARTAKIVYVISDGSEVCGVFKDHKEACQVYETMVGTLTYEEIMEIKFTTEEVM